MPVPTTNHTIRSFHPPESNSSPGLKLLYNIMKYITGPPNEQNEKNYKLLCKAIFHSYNFQTEILDEKELRRYYNKNGYPLSLDEEVLEMRHEPFDSVQQLMVATLGPGTSAKAVVFVRHKGTRKFKFGCR